MVLKKEILESLINPTLDRYPTFYIGDPEQVIEASIIDQGFTRLFTQSLICGSRNLDGSGSVTGSEQVDTEVLLVGGSAGSRGGDSAA